MNKIFAMLMLALMFTIGASTSYGAEKLTMTSNNMKAVLTLEPDTSLIDVYLTDAKTSETIKDAQVKALVKTPSNKRMTIELPGMMMGQTWSYMANLEMTESRNYSINVTAVRKGGKKAKFKFIGKVKR